MEAAPSGDNKQLVKRLFDELWQEGRTETADQVVATDYVADAPGKRDIRGPDGLKELVRDYRSGFPDLVVTVNNQLAEGDRVVTEFSMKGVHTGNWTGVRATGKEISLGGTAFSQVTDGKVARQWYEWDRRKILEQLEIMPRV